MRSSNKRSRGKSNRNNRNPGNIINRVFDSSGPEGKVRGTPQQIIDKYSQLARDAALGNDRVAAENFSQHSEHYTRLLGEAMREAETRRAQAEQQNRERQERDRAEREARRAGEGDQPDVAVDPIVSDRDGDSGLVETPESAPKKRSSSRSRKPRDREAGAGPDNQEPTEAAE